MKDLPSLETLNDLFFYNPINGKLFNKVDRNPRALKGAEAGCLHSYGYRQTRMNDTVYLVHRIIWKMCHGKDPAGELDHIDHDPSNNRLGNLREVTHLENHHNVSMRKDNTSGVTGVALDKKRGKWHATIQVEGKRINLGFFTQRWHAIRARKLAEIGYGFHQNHGAAA